MKFSYDEKKERVGRYESKGKYNIGKDNFYLIPMRVIENED